MTRYDYVIAGAGSAGCVLANRLSADPRTTVLLIEAGGADRHPMFHVPKGSGTLMENEKYAWRYRTTPFGPNQRSEFWTRGKVLGGSSSINGMVYNRGHRADYDELERLGNKGWGWEDVLPIFKDFEDPRVRAVADPRCWRTVARFGGTWWPGPDVRRDHHRGCAGGAYRNGRRQRIRWSPDRVCTGDDQEREAR